MIVNVTCRMDLEFGRGRNKTKKLVLTGEPDGEEETVAVLIPSDVRPAALKALRGFTKAGSRRFKFEAERGECPIPLLAGTYKGRWFTASSIKRASS